MTIEKIDIDGEDSHPRVEEAKVNGNFMIKMYMHLVTATADSGIDPNATAHLALLAVVAFMRSNINSPVSEATIHEAINDSIPVADEFVKEYVHGQLLRIHAEDVLERFKTTDNIEEEENAPKYTS